MIRRILGDPVAIEVEGLQIQGPFDSRWMLSRVKAGLYEPLELELFKDAIASGMTVLDIGANIGWYSIIASRAVRDVGVVHAFEADPRNLLHLRANVRLNGCTNIAVVDAAVADGPGTCSFRMAEKPTYSSRYMSMGDMAVTKTIEVDTVAIDDVLAKDLTVHVIKMDIEGGEAAALRGMDTTLRASPNLKMFIEYEPLALEAAEESPEEFLGVLQSLFEDISVIDEDDRRLVPLGQARLGATQSLLCERVKSA